MKISERQFHSSRCSWIACMVLLFASSNALAEEPGSSDWEYDASMYIWGARLSAITTEGDDATITFFEILRDLNMVVMGGANAYKDKWSINTDVIYMNLSSKQNNNSNILDSKLKIQLKSWIVTPTVGYTFHETKKANFEIRGGFRYLWLKAAVNIDVNDTPKFDESGTESYWDAVVGMRGRFNLNEKWFVPVYGDYGTGDSKYTWQAMAGIGYEFEKFSTVLTYRHLKYDFDNPVLENLIIKGPLIGATFRF